MNSHKGGSFDVFASPPGGIKRTVLIVDGEPSSLQHLSMLLQQFGFKTQTAATARQAYEGATTAPPSIIITALKLFDMHGLNFIKMIRRNPKTEDIPFIVLRTLDDSLDEKYCFSAGAIDCLVKPVSAELLYRAVQGGLEDRPRAAMRYRTILPVWVDTVPFEGGEDVYTLDISEHGLFLRTPHPAPEHTRLFLRINLNSRIVKAETKVIYACPPCKGPYHEPGNGLQFTKISREDREFLRKFMRNELTRGHVPDHELPYFLIDDIIL
jgi:CheY-like chemotaxis protein